MYKVLINGTKQEHYKNDFRNIDTLIDFYLDKYTDNFVTDLIINDEKVSLEINGSSQIQSFDNISKIELKLASKYELAYEAIDSCVEYIDNMTTQINLLIEHYSMNRIDEANQLMIPTIELIDLFVQLVSRIKTTLNVQTQDIEKLKDYEVHLLSVLKAILNAKEKNDIIMLNDLLEYELKDNLTQWKIKIIPQFKNLRSV